MHINTVVLSAQIPHFSHLCSFLFVHFFVAISLVEKAKKSAMLEIWRDLIGGEGKSEKDAKGMLGIM